MISRRVFEKRQNLDKILLKFDEILTIQSEVVSTMIYGFSDQKFAILMPEGSVFCPVHEVPILAAKLKPDIGEEVMEVFKEWGPVYDARRNILQ